MIYRVHEIPLISARMWGISKLSFKRLIPRWERVGEWGYRTKEDAKKAIKDIKSKKR